MLECIGNFNFGKETKVFPNASPADEIAAESLSLLSTSLGLRQRSREFPFFLAVGYRSQ
ncbi:hypothetical protein ABNE30_20170 [Paenibacillus larvae]